MVLGPGGTTVVLGVDVVHLVLLSESLSDTEDIVILCISLDYNRVESVFEQPYLLAFGLERLVLNASLSAETLLPDMKGLNEYKQPLL